MKDDLIERVAAALEPELFCGDPVREHRAASPEQVELAKAGVRAKVRDIIPIVREECARIGYIVCAETRHVSLGDKVATAIRESPTNA